MPAAMHDYRLIFVGPENGRTGVGDYSQTFVDNVRPHFGEVCEVRTLGPGEDRVADIRRYRRQLGRYIAGGRPGRVLVHGELAAGGAGPFWTIAGHRDIPVTATVHDPPQGVWMPGYVQGIASRRLLLHGIHYPLRPVSRALEGVINGRRMLFALTETGRRSIAETYPKTHTVYIPHLVRERPEILAAEQRPKAVGFFGHVYRGKGFEQIAGIRRLLPPDISIRVAGRGTESLPRADGIDIVGPVDGKAEDEFFESVRAVVVPYGKRHFYAETYPASGVVAHATAYCTPIVTTGYGSLAELDEEDGATVVPIDRTEPDAVATGMAEAISSLVNDNDRLARLGKNSARTRDDRSTARTAEAFVAAWREFLDPQL